MLNSKSRRKATCGSWKQIGENIRGEKTQNPSAGQGWCGSSVGESIPLIPLGDAARLQAEPQLSRETRGHARDLQDLLSGLHIAFFCSEIGEASSPSLEEKPSGGSAVRGRSLPSAARGRLAGEGSRREANNNKM